MIGMSGGLRGASTINNWTQHLAHLLEVPDSDIPTPNVDLLWTALPEYKKRGKQDSKQQNNAAVAQASNADLSTSAVTTDEASQQADPDELPAVRLFC